MGVALKLERTKEQKFTYKDYETWEDADEWELIKGVPYKVDGGIKGMAPSANMRHQDIAGKIYVKLFSYLEGKPCKVYADADVFFEEEETIVAPDIFVVCDRNKIKKQYCQGAPDLVVEVLSPSTTKYDKTTKLALYKRQGVREYWIVDPLDNTITVYMLENEKYWAEGYSEDNDFIPVTIFNGELKLDLKYIFSYE